MATLAYRDILQTQTQNINQNSNSSGSATVSQEPMPRHGQGVNAIDDDRFVSSMNNLTTPLLTIKRNLLQDGLFPGCDKNCHSCKSLSNGCLLLKIGVQRLMTSKEILFEKIPLIKTSY